LPTLQNREKGETKKIARVGIQTPIRNLLLCGTMKNIRFNYEPAREGNQHSNRILASIIGTPNGQCDYDHVGIRLYLLCASDCCAVRQSQRTRPREAGLNSRSVHRTIFEQPMLHIYVAERVFE